MAPGRNCRAGIRSRSPTRTGRGEIHGIAEQLKQVNPQAWQQINDHMTAIDTMLVPEQTDALKRALTKGDPRESLAVLHRLTTPSADMSPDQKLVYLAGLSPDQLAQTIHEARNYLQMEQSISQQYEARYQERARKSNQSASAVPRSREAQARQ